jgi:hypothetical protein
MPVPAYMLLKDDGGAGIKGTVDVQYCVRRMINL